MIYKSFQHAKIIRNLFKDPSQLDSYSRDESVARGHANVVAYTLLLTRTGEESINSFFSGDK
jgi:hypothetical protein